MKIIDISMPITSEMLCWPGTPRPEKELRKSHDRGDATTHSLWKLGSHTGTHVDAPGHVLPGAEPLDSIPLDHLIGWVYVLDLSEIEGMIQKEQLLALDKIKPERLLIKTSNSVHRLQPPFDKTYVTLSVEGAQFLVALGVKMVGIDFLGIEPAAQLPGLPTHITLMNAGVTIVEGLDLSEVEEGRYLLCCLPLRYIGSEAAPARAVLLDQISEPTNQR